jgi:tripeptide aminopeptidase
VIGDFLGRAAHSGLRPEAGRNAIVAAATAVNAMKLGRIDPDTTANVGVIEGGTATNVVAERCRLESEVRSLDDARASAYMSEMVDALTWAASATETDVDVTVEEQFRAYRIPAGEPVVKVAEAALSDCSVSPVHATTGGGSDANAFQAKGFRCLNVANGTEANHTPDERVSEAALEKMLDVAFRLLARSAEV